MELIARLCHKVRNAFAVDHDHYIKYVLPGAIADELFSALEALFPDNRYHTCLDMVAEKKIRVMVEVSKRYRRFMGFDDKESYEQYVGRLYEIGKSITYLPAHYLISPIDMRKPLD